MLTTAGFTDLAISTKFFALPPPIGNCGAVATGRTMGLGVGSGPAVPVGNQPIFEATTIPMMTPPVIKASGTSPARTSFINDPCSSSLVARMNQTRSVYPDVSQYFASIYPHDGMEKFHCLRFRPLE